MVSPARGRTVGAGQGCGGGGPATRRTSAKRRDRSHTSLRRERAQGPRSSPGPAPPAFLPHRPVLPPPAQSVRSSAPPRRRRTPPCPSGRRAEVDRRIRSGTRSSKLSIDSQPVSTARPAGGPGLVGSPPYGRALGGGSANWIASTQKHGVDRAGVEPRWRSGPPNPERPPSPPAGFAPAPFRLGAQPRPRKSDADEPGRP